MGRTPLVEEMFRGDVTFLWRGWFLLRETGAIGHDGYGESGEVVENNGDRRGDDEEGQFGEYGGPSGDYGPAGEIEAGQPAAMGKNERASSGLPPERFISRSDGRHCAVGEADADREGRQMGGVVFAADVDAGNADDAGSGSDEAWDEAGGVSGGCWGVRAIGGALHDVSAGFFLEAASFFWRDERGGLDAVGLAAYGSSFEAVWQLKKFETRNPRKRNWKIEIGKWKFANPASPSD